MATKWGVYSAGKICHDFVTSVRSLKSTDHQFVAVAARELKSAQEFAKQQQIPKAYGSYEELAKDPDVQVVYIGTINSAHLSAAKQMLEHGKHVLVEKPMALNTKQTEDLFALAKQKKLFVMEALWSRFIPSYEFVLDQINKGVIGDVLYVSGNLGYKKPEPSRALGGGTTLDIGTYIINLVEQVYNGEQPEKIAAVGHLNKDGVDVDVSVVFQYKNNRTATGTFQSIVDLPNDAVIVGTKGSIKLTPDFQSTQKVYVNDKLHEFQHPPPIIPFIYPFSSGLCYQANEVHKCLKSGQLESHRMSHSDSLTLCKVRDEIRKQVGVKYDVDN